MAINLALNQSRSKVLKTLLVDGDLRRPTLTDRFGLEHSLPGLSECLAGERQLEDSVYKISGSGLWFLPAGLPPENPLELMQAGRVSDVLDRLGKFFDWIIIDSPPAVPVSDASILSKSCDGVVIVVRSNTTPIDMARRAREEFPEESLVGVVLNGTDRETTPYSRYYYDAYVKNATTESKS